MHTGMILSNWSSKSLEDVAAASPDGPRWFQLGILKDRNMMSSLIKRAEKAGYQGIFVTIDSVVFGQSHIYVTREKPQPDPYR